MASLFNFDGALTKREQIPNEMGLGCGRVRDMRCEQYHLRQYESASRFGKRMQASLTKPLEYGIATDLHTTKAISPGEMQPPNTANAAHATGGFM
ncbi:hypothetical protein ACWWIZ_003214 [Cronobacter sakazakii]|nr:hypothetical protein [Cronobacter turicensis]EMA1790066.1 hypothetical protein [Cronobacter turicensis]EMA1800130.1 hypothetical protein [Cronobacter turicensis]EMA1847343.1 hypothetical protein [Cronobacter turicensis]EMA1857588.1 hypothetical protein [Cronobacter turicensis]